MQIPDAQCFTPLGVAAYFIQSSFLSNGCLGILTRETRSTLLNGPQYLRFFLLTLILESLIYLPLMLYKHQNLKRSLSVIIIVNFCTHPLVFFGFPALGEHLQLHYVTTLFLSESFAVFIEAFLIYRILKFTFLFSFLLALVANLFSWGVGSLLQ